MSFEKLAVSSIPAVHRLVIENYGWPYTEKDYDLGFGLVTGMARQDNSGHQIAMPHQFTSGIEVIGELNVDRLTIASEKAGRLIEYFKALELGPHVLDCHDFVTNMEDWDGDTLLDSHIIDRKEAIVPGMPYQVLINAGTAQSPDWIFTHSAMGFTEDRLLGHTAQGFPLGIMTRDVLDDIYGRDYNAHLAALTPTFGNEPQVSFS